MLKLSFQDINTESLQGNLVILLDQTLSLSPNAILIDQKYHGIVSKVLQDKDLFSAKFGATKMLVGNDKDGNLAHILLVGLGDAKEFDDSKVEDLGGKIYSSISHLKIKSFSVLCENMDAIMLSAGARLASYTFHHHFSKCKQEEKASKLEEIKYLTSDYKMAEEKSETQEAIAKGVFFARDLVTKTPNILYPETYAQELLDHLEPLDVNVEILSERDMEALGMGAILCVGQGSVKESKMVVMSYYGADDEDEAPIALVGKGVTFDTGGISLKPSAGMGEMKYDMGGSASVVGTMKTLALRKAKVNVIAVVGLVENMPGGNAQRPSDVVKSMSGQTIEVLNTDAEGRLVLADALWYVQEKFSPKIVIDLATLTGAITIALGLNLYAGLFSNDKKLSSKLEDAGNLVKEKVWPFPMDKEFDEMINSDIADMQNIGAGRGAGSITAAKFLERFIKKDTPWAHIDIAGMAWDKKGSNISPKGAVGFGVKLLNKLIEKYYESK